MKTIFAVLISLMLLSACITAPTAYPGSGEQPTLYPAGRFYYPQFANPTPEPERPQIVPEQNEQLNLPAIIKDGNPAQPTATAIPPSVTATSTPLTATATSAPPTVTAVPGVLPQFVNGGFEDGLAGWQWYSDVHAGIVSNDLHFFDPIYLSMYTWRAFGGSSWAAWMGRIPYLTCPTCEPVKGINGIGERSLLAQQVTIPTDATEAYFTFELLLRSVERACDVDRYPADMIRLYIGNAYDPSRPVTTDDIWIGFLGVCRDHTTVEYRSVTLPFNFGFYAGQTKWFKLLTMNDLGGSTHFFIDDIRFTNEAPTGIGAQSVDTPRWRPPEDYLDEQRIDPGW